MIDWKKLFTSSTFRYIDQSEPSKFKPIASFAMDDTLAISVGNKESAPTVRLWVHDNTVILGIPDARLPYIEDGIKWLNQQNYKAVVRNSGGLAVVLDSGVLNMSLILPDVKKLGIRDGYEAMVHFTKYIFKELTDKIEAFEVEGSYCPGEYDLSIDGKKFAGISQRRVKNGAAVQIYLCVEGSGEDRARLIQEFYKRGLRDEKGKFEYPNVRPETMSSLSGLLGKPLTVSDVIHRIHQGVIQLSEHVIYDELNLEEQATFKKRLEQMVERNKKVFSD